MPLTLATEKFFKQLEEKATKIDFSTITIEEFRQLGKELESLMGPPADNVRYKDFKKQKIILHNSDSCEVRIFTPKEFNSLGATIIYFPGCGFASELDMHWAACSHIAVNSGCRIILVQYPLAPENKFPKAFNIGLAVVNFLIENAHDFKICKENVILAGDSSGGNLCALIVNELYRKTKLRVTMQVLISPWVDISMQTYVNTPFYDQQKQDKLLTEEVAHYYKNLYLPKGYDGSEPEVSPLYEKDLHQLNLPPTVIMAGEYDGLRGETESYYELLQKTGVRSKKIIWSGHTHNAMIARKVLSDGDDPAVIVAREIKNFLQTGKVL